MPDHPDQDVRLARRFLFETATTFPSDPKLYWDYADLNGDVGIVLKPLDATPNSIRQHFRVWITGQIQSVANEGENYHFGYLTRKKKDGLDVVILEQFEGHNQNQIWNFVPGRSRPLPIGPVENRMFTGVATPHDPKTLKPAPRILQAMGASNPVQVMDWAVPYADPWTEERGNQVPINQSWHCPEV
jgi:hypothetical protein